MLNPTKISAILLTLTLGLATTATSHAEEVSLEGLVAQILSQSAVSLQQELNNDIQGAMLTAANQFNIYEEEIYATKTSITDLDSNFEETDKHAAE
jgi:hypothetical protein